MKEALARLASDFLSAIVFLVVYLATDNVILATAVAIAGVGISNNASSIFGSTRCIKCA